MGDTLLHMMPHTGLSGCKLWCVRVRWWQTNSVGPPLSELRHAVTRHLCLLSHECESVPKATDSQSHQRKQQHNRCHFRKRIEGMSKRLLRPNGDVVSIFFFFVKRLITFSCGVVGVPNGICSLVFWYDATAVYCHSLLSLSVGFGQKKARIKHSQTDYLFFKIKRGQEWAC